MPGCPAARLHWAASRRSRCGVAVQGELCGCVGGVTAMATRTMGVPATPRLCNTVAHTSPLGPSSCTHAPLHICPTSALLHACLQMALKADYWDCPATLGACCTQLRKALDSPTLTAAVLIQLFTLLPEQVSFVQEQQSCCCSAAHLPFLACMCAAAVPV